MRNAILCLSAFITITLSGCVSNLPARTFQPASLSISIFQLIHLPNINTQSEAEIGQSIVSIVRRSDTPAIKLDSNVEHTGKNQGWTFTLNIPSNEVMPLVGTDERGKFYESKSLVIKAADGTILNTKGGIYIPNEKLEATEIYFMAANTHVPLCDKHPGVSYKTTNYEEWGEGSFKRELVYSGVSQNTISILYREFKNDMARPAFSQELKYDLSQGTEIGYKGARFEVLKANNTGITYMVLKPLD